MGNKVFADPLRDLPPNWNQTLPQTQAEWDAESEKHEEKLLRIRKRHETATGGTILSENYLEHDNWHLPNFANCDLATDALMALIPGTTFRCWNETDKDG